MSTLRVDAIQNRTGGDLITAKGMARAWVSFNGTGTVAINQSFNVSSITDNGVGDYTLNFATALADGDYAIVGMNENGQQTATVKLRSAGVGSAPTLKTSTQARVHSTTTSTNFDSYDMSFIVFR